MPRNTRSSTAAKKQGAGSHRRAGGPRANAEKQTPPLVNGGRVAASTSPLATTPALGSFSAEPVSVGVTPQVIKGVRMGGVKHSGLLARDEKSWDEVADQIETAEETPNLGLSFNEEDPSPQFPIISGREIYSVKKGAKKRQTPKGGTTPTPLKPRDGGKKRESNSAATATAKGKQKIVNRKRRESPSSDEPMEEEDPIISKKSGRRATHSHENSDEDLSNSSEDDELGRIAERLNRGDAPEEVSENMLEDYFTVHSGRAGHTSDHTLARLVKPQMDQGTVESTLRETPSVFHDDCQSLYEEHRNLFPYWLYQMSNGYNILLYGLGSKRKLVESFRNEHLASACHLVVNGYFPGLTVKQILTTLSSDLLDCSESFKSLTDHAELICTALEKGGRRLPKELFLLIHNIDGPMLRSEKAQLVLSILAPCPKIHVIATVDHINAPLIWDQNKLSRFNWIWHDITTFELYHEETSYENSLLVQQSSTLALSSLIHVTKSLTPNACGIFELLARYQLDHEAEADSGNQYLGLSFHECYLKCREKFLVNSDLTLKTQLTEFRDHKLVRSRKGPDGVEYLYIPVDEATLTQFLEQQSQE